MGELAVLDGGAPARGTVNLIEVARQAEAAKALGATLIASGLLPDAIKRPEQAVLIILKGQELDLAPVYALSHLVVIQGKPAMSAELMRALVQRAGHRIRIVESTRERATVEGIRRDDPEHVVRISFDEEDAKLAGLYGKGGHRTYPAAMKLARATSMLCRAAFADALGGVSYVPEELGAEVDEEGEIVSVQDRPEPRRAAAEEPEPVEEAEVAGKGRSEEHERILAEMANAMRSIAPDKRPDKRTAWDYAFESEENARKSLGRLRTLAERYPHEDPLPPLDEDPTSDDGEEEAIPGYPPETDISGGYGDMRGAAQQAATGGARPARKSQKDLIRTLAVELAGAEDGAERLEERRGIKIDDLSFEEADELIDELGSDE